MTSATSWRLPPPPPPPRLLHVEMVMGTAVTFDVRLATEDARAAAEAAVAEAVEWLHWVDRTFTTYDESSWVCRLRRDEVTLEQCPAELTDVIARCREWRDRTDGWFDPWAGPEGFDPSGYVKGWAAQRASDLLRERGLVRHCLNAGGDVVAVGAPDDAPTWGIGIVDPFDRQRLRFAVRIVDCAVATSGTGERGLHVWGRDGAPAHGLASVTVLDAELISADVIATTALAMGELAESWLADLGAEALLIDANNRESLVGDVAQRLERFA